MERPMAGGTRRVRGRRQRGSAKSRQRKTATRSLLAKIPSDEFAVELSDQHHRALKTLIENDTGDAREEQILRWLIHFTEMELSGLSDQDWAVLYDQLQHLLRGPWSVRGFGPRFPNVWPDTRARQQIVDAQAEVTDCLRSLARGSPYECVFREGAWVFSGVYGDRSKRKRVTLIRQFSGALPSALVDAAGRSLEVAGIHRLRACLRPACDGRLFLAAARGDQKYCRPRTEAQEAASRKHNPKRRKTPLES